MAFDVGVQERALDRDAPIECPCLVQHVPGHRCADPATTEGRQHLGVEQDPTLTDQAVLDEAGELRAEMRFVTHGLGLVRHDRWLVHDGTIAPHRHRELTRAFNTMASRLESDQHQRRSPLADVSHELRTPLAILRGNLEAIADGIHEPDEGHVAGLIEETRVLERLVEDLRTISLAEAGELPLHRESTDPDVLLGDTVGAFQAVADRKGVALVLDAPSDLPLLDVDPVRIREVIANLLANAIRHTPEHGTVTVTGRHAAERVLITVADTGSGIDPALLPNVFERFARGNESPGSGLGLAIARDLVTVHGGSIEVSSVSGGGTTFVVGLPSADGQP